MEGETKTGRHTIIKNFFVGRNPDTGRPYFEKRRVPVIKPGELPPEPPDMDILPPINEKGEIVKDTQPQLPNIDGS